MNRNQKVVLIVVMVVLGLMLFFPPFYIYNLPIIGGRENLGYGFLFSPPASGGMRTASVDIRLLLTQWVGVVAVGGIALLLLKD